MVHNRALFLAACGVVLAKTLRWVTNKDIAQGTGVSVRRVSFHTNNLVQLGILDQAEVSPGHRFTLSPKADKRNIGYVRRLQQAGEIFGGHVAS